MTEKILIPGNDVRYLHSDEVFRKEMNWNINLPDERKFKNGYCIVTDKDNTAYSIDELVYLLNELHKKSAEEQLNYLQNLIDEAIKHSKTKIEQKTLQKIIEEYNKYMLNHK